MPNLAKLLCEFYINHECQSFGADCLNLRTSPSCCYHLRECAGDDRRGQRCALDLGRAHVINWRETLKIPRIAKLSPEAEKLILELCTNAEERLGAHQIKHHPFLKSVDFTKNIRDAEAPYKPTIRFPTDTSNFDPVSPDKLRGSSSSWGSSESNGNHKNHKSKGNHRQTEHAFFEFTFRRFFDDGGHPYSTPMRMNFDFPPQTPINREDLEAETTKASEPQEPVYV
ncbi:hypothetical protein BSL78_11021 [Apostichopus japonicus]|uniref:non-specific serine/threonine protein kinase n=1 Tax=Stichopus japonicus TaxID=307972 RepID=A0A2G8KVN8_STIJA|nr:hypothetical protein BSL78_11021 [Apostichopus japonicus]